MKDYNKVESCLKSFLKNNKRLSYSMALLISFLINGGFSYADEAIQVPLRTEIKTRIEKEQENISQMLKETDESMKDIELKIKKLTQRGEFWVKPLEKSYQGFIFANWGNYSKNKNKTESNFNGPEYSASYGSSMGYGQFSNGKYYGEYGIVKNPLEFVDKIDFGANITPKAVTEKTIVEKTVIQKIIEAPRVTPPIVTIATITPPTVSTPTIGTMSEPGAVTVNVIAPGTPPTLSPITVTPVTALNINPTPPTVGDAPTVTAPTVEAPATPAGFTPRLITPPEKPEAVIINSPNIFTPPEINFKGKGFGQGAEISMPRSKIVIQNYDSYDTVDKNNNTKGIINIEVGNLGGVLKSKWWGTNLDGTINSNIQMKAVTNVPNAATPGLTKGGLNTGGIGTFYLAAGQSSSPLNAFINELRDHNATISGNYVLTNKGGEGDINRNVIFLSHNPAGVGGKPGGYYDGQGKAEAKTATFNGTLTLNGTSTTFTGNTASSDVTIGVEHQLWSARRHAQDWVVEGAYSIFDNKGTITLASGNNLVGILIDVEAWNDNKGPAHKTINSNLIQITNAQNSIGIDYGEYANETFKSDLTIGNIIVGGKKNYGLRMANIFSQSPNNPNYFDKGTTIQSGGADKKILVQGEENVGVSIAKFLSSTANTNPIANISGLNITVDGKDGVGFLRNKDYSTNNTNDMILNSTTMGTFLFGENATGSTLIRSDKYGITIAKNITVNKGKEGNSFAQAIDAGTITNSAVLKNTNGVKFTGLITKKQNTTITTDPLVTNSGTIEITGDGANNNENIGIAALANGKVVNTGTITVIGKGKKKVGIYNDGKKVELKDKTIINIGGESSSGVYNKSIMEISATTDKVQINAKNGSTGIYSNGGSITSTAGNKLEITVDNSSSDIKKGLGVYADNKAIVNLTGAKIKVIDGEAGIAAYDNITNIDLTNSTIDYKGNGYAVYSDGNGKINLTNSNIALRGSSTLMDLNLAITPANRPITTSGTTVKVYSNDVVAVNLTNLGTKNISDLPTLMPSLGLNISPGTEGGNTFDKYKELAIDDATINFNVAVDKSEAATTTGGYFFKRVLGQRLKLNVNENVTANLTTAQANDDYNGQVVGIEANSSKKATSNSETQVNIATGKKIEAARTDGTDKGATGVFINYGQLENKGTISVEKDATANSGAVGVYAVNGSDVKNEGNINVGGKQSVGILALAYRENPNTGVSLGAEFGTGAVNQGKINVTNTSNITMSDDDAIGIYAKNNNTSAASNDYKVTNTGTIEVKKSVSKTAIGIYADKSTVLPKDGTIKIGEKAVGIYAKDSIVGVAGNNLGNIDFNGANGVGIYLKNNSTLLGNKVTLKQSATGTLAGKVGILADTITNKTLNTEVVADTGVNDVIAYYSKNNGTLTVQADISLNENSTGITGADSENLVYSGSKTMKLGQKSTGIFGQKNIDFSNGSNIELNGNSSVGVFAKGTSGVINSNGNIKFTKENSIGLYGANGATVIDNTASMDFTNINAKNNIGVYLAGAKWIDNRTAAYTFNSDHSKNNIYLFAQGSRNNGTDIGSTATLKNEFKVNPSGSASSTAKTIGMYFNTAVKGESTFVDNTLDMTNANSKISVTNSGIGVYAKNTTGSGKNNIINKIKVSSTGTGSVGVFTDGDLKLSGTNGLIEAKSNGIGLYGNSGKVTVENEHKVEVTSAGTGMYMTNGSYLSGGTLELENKTTGTTAAGIYYTKGSNNNEVTHNTKLKINHGSNLLALYVDGGIKLNNTEEIAIDHGKNNVAAYITGGSTFKNNSTITVGMGNDLESGIGMYVVDGEAINESGKTLNLIDANNASGLSIGMIAKAASGKTAKVTNKGTINAVGEVIGMNVEDNSEGANSGTITATDKEISGTNYKSIGAYINGANAKFTNTGTISTENIGLALKDTTANKILNSGTLKLTKTGAVGVYANNSIVDFNIAPEVTSSVSQTVVLYATGNTKIAGQITTAAGKSHVGVYAEGNAEFQSGSKVTVGDGIEDSGTTYYGIGIYTKSGYNKAANVDLKLNGLKTIGFYLGATGTTGSTVTHTGTIDVGSGIGTFIPKYSKFVAQNTTFNVGNGGTAVYLKGGEADLGSTGTANINFTGSGRAVYQDGGTLTTGAGLHITGTGSFLTLKNANSIINSIVNVGADGIGINGIYDSNAQDYTLKLDSPTGHIKLSGNKATGIAAVDKNTVAPKKVDIINRGTIETISGSETTGIYGKGANIENATGAKINIGAKGVGIYTTNYYDNSTLSLTNTTLKNNGEINLTGDEATGIVAVKAHTTQDFIGGKITGTKDKLVGMFFDNSAAQTKVKDFDISLGTNAKGLIFKDGQDFTITSSSTNKVTIGNTTNVASRGIGISALGVNGTVSNTEVKVGKNSLGLYTKDKKLTFDLATGKLESSDSGRSSILAYADGNNSEVALNGGGTLKVGANGIALGTRGGKITANVTTNVEVDGVKGLGAYVENGGSISNNFDIKIKSAEGIGMYAKGGALTSVAKVSELKGNKSIGYVFENITNAITMPNSVQLTDTNATGQVGVVAQGTGNGLTVTGISVVGSENTGVYSSTGKAVVNNGTLTVGDSTGKSSIGIYSKEGAVTSIGNATIGKNSIAIYGKDTAATLNGNLNIGEKGIGLYVDNTATSKGDTAVNGNITVGANGAIGIQTTNSKVNLTGDLSVASGDSKGIFSMGAGNLETTGNINVGNNSVGIYKNGSGEIKTALGSIGKTLTVADSGYGVFSKGAKLINNMNVTVGVDAIGAYVDGNDLTSTGTVTVADKGVGLLVKGTGKTLTSTGNITVGSNNSVGLYAGDNANISQSGNITVADNNGIGVYSKGSGNISTVGAMTVGKDSIGVYKDGKGTMNINASSPIQTMTIAEKGYGLYYKGNSRADSIINSNMNMTLGKEAVGIYAKNTTVNHTGDITVGETTIGSSGFTTPSDNKNSIGIFGDNSNINFKGNMLVDKPLSVGIYGANGGSITVKSGSTITVKNGATGIMTGSKVENITLESGSTLNVDGKVDTNVYTNATKSNVSFGIAAYSGLIDNQGTINVTNGATGIYLAGTASLKNGATGTINIDATSKSTAKPDTKASAELGGIKVTDKGVVTINNKVINGGTLNVKGALNMEGLGLDVSTGKTVVDAKSISGVAEVLPSFSRGNSEQKVTIKDVFRTGVVGAFSGDVKSKSVSWIAKISKEPGSSTTTSDITMVRIPYNSLISGERYKNLASGLEDIRSKIGKDSSSPIFKSLDNISSHRDFARAVANIRGDIYSNIQERMKTVENSFDKTYNELLSSYNKTRNADKFSVIYTGGEHKDGTLGVSGYKYKSTGVLYLNDREAFTYGGKYGWSAGIVGSNFEFNGDTNKGSKERVVSGKLGLHYQTPLNKDDDNARLKWLTRGEVTVNNHRTKRYSQVGADTYQNKVSFYSTELSWKNTIYYDYDINTNWTVKPYTGIDISYGHIFNIKEKNEGLPLEVKGKDYFVITPNVGVETKYILPLGAVHQAFAKVDTEFSYDVTKLYHGVNQAKMRNASTGYYDLSKPERRRARVAVGAELGLEKENTYGITFRAEYQGYKKSQLNYGVRLNYKF